MAGSTPAQVRRAEAASLLDAAPAAETGTWDELRDAAGALRPPWQRMAAWLPAGQAGAADLDRRVLQVAQQLQRDGVTHNVFSVDGVAARPWSLELLPLVITAADWALIEAGVRQRARLLEAVLSDLYGAQRLLHDGCLPAALLMRHPGWLRPLVGTQPAGGQHLFIAAFDLAHGPDGTWHLVAQRTQVPSGLGYVLHNRLVIARQFPEPFRELRVQRIATSYRRLLDSIEQRAAPLAGGAAPRVVLLTPGAYSETYFEHAYLARYLGVPLAEGGDLTVRGERLYLRTVEGLEPVHAVLRRIDDDWCDPLELRPDSALGVPGLLQAARAGTVVMANALGSAFLETPALLGFLPGMAERLLGEPLLLPARPSWWCGEAATWADARARLPELVARSTFPRGVRSSAVLVGDAALIDADPDAWTLQARQRLAQAPIWCDGAIAHRPALVRVYAVVDGTGQWHVLPGGMTRVAGRGSDSVSLQRGGTSLDTWVLTDGPVDSFSMLNPRLTVADIVARRTPVASRTGENLFWLGRYTERAEQAMRLARATLALIDDDHDATEPEQHALSALALRAALVPPGVPTLAQAPQLFERAVLASLADEEGADGAACSVAFNLCALEQASQALRERLSAEHWGLIRALREDFQEALAPPQGAPAALPTRAQALAALDRLALRLAAVTGAQTDRMTRDHGWRLLTVGRLLERLAGLALRMQALLEAQALGSAAGIELLLELFDSAITFRARYQRHEDLLPLADLLVLDSTNPRSFAGVLRRLRTEIGKLPGPPEVVGPLLAELPAEGAGLSLEDLSDKTDAELATALLALARNLGRASTRLSDQVNERFFTLAHGQDQRV